MLFIQVDHNGKIGYINADMILGVSPSEDGSAGFDKPCLIRVVKDSYNMTYTSIRTLDEVIYQLKNRGKE